MKSADAQYSPMNRKLFLFGIGLFVIVKLLWIWIPVIVMGMPRLGDDALVYLWWGRNNFVGLTSPAVTDVLSIHNLSGYTTPNHLYERNRVTMRVTGAVPSPVSLVVGGLVTAGVDPKYIFALQETVVLSALACGLGILLYSLFGPAAAGIAFVFLTFAILPIQGIHFLIPGVLALSLGLVMFVLATKDKPNVVAVFVLALIALLTHQIGLVYVAIASALNVLHAIILRTYRQRVSFLVAVAAAGAVACIWWTLFGSIPESSAGRGGLSLSYLPGNAAGIWHRWSGGSVKMAIGLAGLVWGLIHFRLHSPITLIVITVLAAIIASLAYDIPGYPGDVGLRLIVVLFILACGGAGAALANLTSRRFGKMIIGVVIGAFVCGGLVSAYRLMISNANNRYHLLDFRELRQVISTIPPHATILYAEAETALMSMLLAGGERFGAIPYRMLRTSPHLQSVLKARKPSIIALVPPRALSGYSIVYSSSPWPRFYGYRFDEFRRIEITKPPETDVVYLRMDALSNVDRISISANAANSGSSCNAPKLEPATGSSKGWYRVVAPGCAIISLEARDTASIVAINGLSFSEPDIARSWPWGRAGARLRAIPRRSIAAADVDFSWDGLLRSNRASDLLPLIRGSPSLLTDRGGIILALVEIE